jgi:hypothetical protein
MVGTARFELATPCTPSKCATRLRYVPMESAVEEDGEGLTGRFYTTGYGERARHSGFFDLAVYSCPGSKCINQLVWRAPVFWNQRVRRSKYFKV